jgi:hypothetical protein
MLSLTLPAAMPAVTPAHADDPPIRVKLSDDELVPGDHGKVRVKLAEAGYLVVLRADANGHVRVLYPLNPTDSAVVPGGKEFEVRGRGDREAFTVDERQGTGTILAARSPVPFHFDEFQRGQHWDYRALAAESASDDPEAALVDIVDRMAPEHYDYDVATYTVAAAPPGYYLGGYYGPWYHPYYLYPYYYPFGFRASILFGRPHHFFRGRRW